MREAWKLKLNSGAYSLMWLINFFGVVEGASFHFSDLVLFLDAACLQRFLTGWSLQFVVGDDYALCLSSG